MKHSEYRNQVKIFTSSMKYWMKELERISKQPEYNTNQFKAVYDNIQSLALRMTALNFEAR